MRLKILSDGTPGGTRIVDARTGEVVQNITDIEWAISRDTLSTATVKIVCISADMIGETEEGRGEGLER